MRFLICLIVATMAGLLHFRLLSWTIDRALRKSSSGAQALMALSFLLRYIGWGVVLVVLIKWDPYGAIAAALGFLIGMAMATAGKLIRR